MYMCVCVCVCVTLLLSRYFVFGQLTRQDVSSLGRGVTLCVCVCGPFTALSSINVEVLSFFYFFFVGGVYIYQCV